MKRTSLLPSTACAISGAMLLISGCAAHTQMIGEGVWRGTMTAPPVSGERSGVDRDVTYELEVEGGEQRITLVGQYGDIPMRDVRVDGEHLRFSFVGELSSPGRRFTGWFDCELELQEDHSYRGDCTTPAGFRTRPGLVINSGVGRLVMIPPDDRSP